MTTPSQPSKHKAKQSIRTLAVGIGVVAFIAILHFTQGTEYKELGIIVAVIIWAALAIALALTVPREVWGHLKKWFGPR
jgi:hypothetical protein